MPENTNRNNRPTALVPRRNFVAKNQWQRGGVHEKTSKAKRQKSKQQLKKAIRAKQFGADFFAAIISLKSVKLFLGWY